MSTSSFEALRKLTPAIGFPVTICVLCYGPHADLADRFLRSLFGTTNPSLFHLRAGLNEVESATCRLFDEYSARYGNIDVYREPRNIFKSPLMHRLFHEKPIASRWTLWCDDDTHFTRSDWLQRLALRLEHSRNIAMWGSIYLLRRNDEEVLDWIRQAPWYRQRPFRRRTASTGIRSVEFRFATGGYWAVRTAVLRRLNWPDRRLIQSGEDFLLGEALRQMGARIGDFHYGVSVSDAPRRNAEAGPVRRLLCGLGPDGTARRAVCI